MRFNKLSLIILVFILLGWSCKSVRTVTPTDAPQVPAPSIAETLIEEVRDSLMTTPPVEEIAEIPRPELHLPKRKDTLAIIGVGDIMMGTNYPEKNLLPPNDGKDLLAEVREILRDADITFGNLEGVILSEGGTPKSCKDPSICYVFRSPEHYMQNLVDAGFNLLSLANNHSGDFGEIGRKNTVKTLEEYGIWYAGFTSCPYVTFEKDGIKYGFAAFAPNSGTVPLNDLKNARSIVTHLDSISDIVIVSFHGGAEGAQYQHVTRQTETFYGENRGNVYQFAHQMVDAGADIVFGHGPHVTRAVEVYNDRFIAYSLGNFCTYGKFNLSGDNGIAPIVKVFTKPDGTFLYAEITPIVQPRPGGPRIDPQNRVIKKLQHLTKKDFPEVPLSIDDTGIITILKTQ
jgi:hypothetical protein